MPPPAPYGTWPSPVTPALAASGAVRLGGLVLDGGAVAWIEGRPAEGGRNVIMRRGLDGAVTEVTPPGFNVRSRVHEYGGGAFTARNGVIYFVNDADQRIWRQDPESAPAPLTPEGPFRFADLVLDPARPRLVCVREDHGRKGEPENSVVSVPCDGGTPRVMARGADFYASPRLDDAGA